jgi:TRAP-type C4-dicarboxylate transport system permease small subunit
MKSLLQPIGSLVDKVVAFLAWLAGGLMVFALVTVCMDVIMRYFFNRPIGWVLQFSEYILLYIPFLAAAYVLREDSHIRVDIVLNRLSERTQEKVNTVTSVVGCVVLLVLAYYGAGITIDYWRRQVPTLKYLKIPEYLVIAVIPVGCFFFALQFLRKAKDHWRAARRGSPRVPGGSR